MASIIEVIEYNEGFAIITDTEGQYVVTQDSDKIQPLETRPVFQTEQHQGVQQLSP